MKRVALMPIQDSMLVRTGAPLLSALLAKGMNILMSCGGNGLCATCHIHVREGMDQLSPKEAREQRTLLLLANADASSRLACQTKVLGDGVVLELPQGMYIEKMEDLLGLLGTRAPENILHPVDGRILIPKGKIITRTLLERSRSLADEVKKLKAQMTSQSSVLKSGNVVSVTICSGVAPDRQDVNVIRTTSSRETPSSSGPQSSGNKLEASRLSEAKAIMESSRTDLKKSDALSKRDSHKLSSSTHKFSLDETKLKHPPVSHPRPTQQQTGPSPDSESPEGYERTVAVPVPSIPVLVSSTRREPVPHKLDPENLESGLVFGRCMILERIGHGSYGIVYRGLHVSLRIPVAIKFLHVKQLMPESDARERFRIEAYSLAQLNHPNVVRVLDFDDSDLLPYVVLEYVEGFTLAELIDQSGHLQIDRACNIIMQAVRGLAAAHALGIVHRDVKPGNIIVNRQGVAKLVDLGLALFVRDDHRRLSPNDSGHRPGFVEGTVAYMSPEQALDPQHVDHRSDIYSLGATFYHAVTGRLPFSGRSRNEVIIKHLQEPLIPPHEIVPDLHPMASAIIQMMMAKSPSDRFQSYEELENALGDLQRSIKSRESSASQGTTSRLRV